MTPDTSGFWEVFWFLFGGGLMTGVLVIALVGWLFWPRAVPEPPQAEQVMPEPAEEEVVTVPLPAIPLWPFSDYRPYDMEIDGICAWCGGSASRKGASLQ